MKTNAKNGTLSRNVLLSSLQKTDFSCQLIHDLLYCRATSSKGMTKTRPFWPNMEVPRQATSIQHFWWSWPRSSMTCFAVRLLPLTNLTSSNTLPRVLIPNRYLACQMPSFYLLLEYQSPVDPEDTQAQFSFGQN